MPVSSSAENIIKFFEGLRLKAYQDERGIWTIGYGSTWNHIAGRKVQQGDTITEKTAIEWIRKDMSNTAKKIDEFVKIPINSNQRDSLTSFAYNIGVNAFANSTLLKLLNAGKPKEEVAKQLLRWNKVKKDGVYVVSNGLTNRRQKEYELFLR